MKTFKNILLVCIALFIGSFNVTNAQLSVIRGPQGGTNTSSTTVGNIGNCLKVASVNPLTWTIGTCGTSGFTTTTFSAAGNTISQTSYTLSSSTDTNIGLTIGVSGSTITYTPVWIGTLADARITSASTWNAKLSSSSLSVAYAPLSYNSTTGVFSLPTSTASQSGFLSSADWNTFNNKISSQWTTNGASIYYVGDASSTNFTATGTSTAGAFRLFAFSNDPQIYANGDSNTGVVFQGPDVLEFMTGGIDTLHITSIQNVGIGTSTPQKKLVVNGETQITSLNTGLVKSTSGVIGNATSGIDYQTPLGSNYVSSTVASATSGLVFSGSTGAVTLYNNGVTSTIAGTNIVQTTNGGTNTINTTTTPSFTSITYPDATKQSTAYKDTGFNVINTSSTDSNGASSTIQKIYYKASTITQVDCSSSGSSITIQADSRASSTPQTYGTNIFTGLVCTNTGVSTSTFSSASLNANTILNFWTSSVPNSTTTLRVSYRTKEQ